MREVVGHHCGIDEGLRLMLEVQYQIPALDCYFWYSQT